MVNFKKIIRIAYANGWITKDPFVNWKVRLKEVEREFLTQEELDKLLETTFGAERLEHVGMYSYSVALQGWPMRM